VGEATVGADESIGEWFARVVELSLQSDGAAEVVFDTGEQVSGRVAAWGDAATTAIASSKCLPKQFELHLVTSTGDEIRVELPRPDDVAPLRGRPTVYLDQNHLSTLTNALHAPARHGSDERAAALGLIDLVRSGEVVLPMSAGHVGETAKQANEAERYRRALTLAQLSGGWQLLDPLTVRRIELRQALARRYLAHSPSSFAVVTLAPGSVSIAKPTVHDLDNDTELPPAARWIFETVSSISAVFEAMLAESIPMSPVPDWAPQFEAFARFLEANPSGPELKKNRTLAKFIADLGTELPIAAHQAGVSGDQMSDWALTFSEIDLVDMPSLGVFRWVMHEKVSDPHLRWEQNDLIDMMYLSVAVGYCDHVVGERSHTAHIQSALRRLNRDQVVHRNLQSLMATL
jgi:hypothetical protein